MYAGKRADLVVSAGLDDVIVDIIPSAEFAFPEVRHRNLLVRRERRESRRTKGHSGGGGDGGNSNSGGGGDNGGSGNPPSDFGAENSGGGGNGGSAPFNPNCGGLGNEQCMDGGPPCHDGLMPMIDGGVSVICRRPEEQQQSSNNGNDGGVDQGNQLPTTPSHSDDSPFPQLNDFLSGGDVGEGSEDGGSGNGGAENSFGGDGGFSGDAQPALSGSDGGAGDNGGQDVFAEEEFVDEEFSSGDGSMPDETGTPFAGFGASMGGDSEEAPMPSGGGAGQRAPPPMPSFEDGGPPRSGNGTALSTTTLVPACNDAVQILWNVCLGSAASWVFPGIRGHALTFSPSPATYNFISMFACCEFGFETFRCAGKAFEQCPTDGKWNIKDWNLEELIGKNFLFFEAQESGELPAGNRIKWRGNSYLNDKHKDRLLNYGWFDAGGAN